MKLVLMRHGEAESNAPSDKERPLTRYGRSNSQASLQVLIEKGVIPDIIVASPYLRAQQTATIVADVIKESFGKDVDIETCSLITPDCEPAAAIRFFADRPEQTVMVVTHNPFVSTVVSMLCSGSNFVRMGTSSLVCLEADVVALGSCDLLWESHS